MFRTQSSHMKFWTSSFHVWIKYFHMWKRLHFICEMKFSHVKMSQSHCVFHTWNDMSNILKGKVIVIQKSTVLFKSSRGWFFITCICPLSFVFTWTRAPRLSHKNSGLFLQLNQTTKTEIWNNHVNSNTIRGEMCMSVFYFCCCHWNPNWKRINYQLTIMEWGWDMVDT